MAIEKNDLVYRTEGVSVGVYKIESTRDGRYRFCKSLNGQFFLPAECKLPDGVYQSLNLQFEQNGKDGSFRVVGVSAESNQGKK